MIDLEERAAYLNVLQQRVESLFKLPVRSLDKILGGENNLLHKIVMADGQAYVAKRYFQDDRCRLDREYSLLEVLKQQGFTNLPIPVVRFDDLQAALYTFVEGTHVMAADLTEAQLDAIVAYLHTLQRITPADVSKEIRAGISSVSSLQEMAGQIRKRMEPFQERYLQSLDPRIRSFLDETQVLSIVETTLQRYEQRFHTQLIRILPEQDRRLSSVDFGPHNMLWKTDGSLIALDFEYGGWDHPLAIITDMIAHDQLRGMSKEKRDYLLRQYMLGTSLPESTMSDLEAFLVFADIQWTMIFMTSLLPEKMARLRHATGSEQDVEMFYQKQMQKIRERLPAFT